MGDPGGVGPEIIHKALSDKALRDSARWIITGVQSAIGWPGSGFPITATPANGPMPTASNSGPGSVTLLDFGHLPTFSAAAPWPNRANAPAGDASFQFVRRAIELAKLDASSPWRADAVVTAPINKESWSLAGHAYPGHTELFAESFASNKFAMMFHAPAMDDSVDAHSRRLAAGLNVILATVHCPLREVPTRLTTQRVLDAIELGARAMRRLGVAAPRLGVCGLNPHAGEHGLLGHEDESIIKPAVDTARAKGINAVGPLPADTIFQGALAFPGAAPSRFDLVVAMYHDQGLIPLKTIAWDRAVNMTVGLPIIRTSPDHGTAFDIAGQSAADAGSMKAALALAVRLARGGAS